MRSLLLSPRRPDDDGKVDSLPGGVDPGLRAVRACALTGRVPGAA